MISWKHSSKRHVAEIRLCAAIGVADHSANGRDTGKITDAQRARGMETEGKLWVRFKSFLPLLGPVVLNSLKETRERSIALEIRGFNAKGKRTFCRTRKLPISEFHSELYCSPSFWLSSFEGDFMSLLRVENLKYKYPDSSRFALNDISFTLKKANSSGLQA